MKSEYCWSRYGEYLVHTIEWFRSRGKEYREQPWRHNFLHKYSKGLGLDLGSGIASTTRYLLYKGLLDRLVLLDLVEESLKKVCGIDPRINCVVGDILDPPFQDNLFDTIYLLAVLHHIPGSECRDHVLKEVYRMLRHGGVLIATLWNPDLKLLLKSREYVGVGDREYIIIDSVGRRYYYFYELEEIVKQVTDIGFHVVEKGYFIQNLDKPTITRNIYVVAVKP